MVYIRPTVKDMKKQIKESSVSEQIRGLAVLVEQTNDGVKLIAEQHGVLVDKIDGLDKKIDAVDHKLSNRIDNLDQRLSGKIDALDKKLSNKIEYVTEQVAELSVDMTIVKEDVEIIKEDLKKKADIVSLA